jgi:hypothetical protein
MATEVKWTNPNSVNLSKGLGMLYFIKVVDDTGSEFRYVGQTRRGKSRLREYKNNVRKIFEGKPRRTTKGQERYRPVHLALAKACECGWHYDFFPIENVSIEEMNVTEQIRISELDCTLNVKWSWFVENYHDLNMTDIPK